MMKIASQKEKTHGDREPEVLPQVRVQGDYQSYYSSKDVELKAGGWGGAGA